MGYASKRSPNTKLASRMSRFPATGASWSLVRTLKMGLCIFGEHKTCSRATLIPRWRLIGHAAAQLGPDILHTPTYSVDPYVRGQCIVSDLIFLYTQYSSSPSRMTARFSEDEGYRKMLYLSLFT